MKAGAGDRPRWRALAFITRFLPVILLPALSLRPSAAKADDTVPAKPALNRAESMPTQKPSAPIDLKVDRDHLPHAKLVFGLPLKDGTVKSIEHLRLEKDEPQVTFSGDNGDAALWVRIRGTYQGPPGWVLIHSFSELIELNPDGSFEFAIQMTRKARELELTAVGPDGIAQDEVVGILLEPFDESMAALLGKEAPKSVPESKSRLGFNAGLATTYLDYTEKLDDIHLTEIGLTGKVGLYYRLVPKKWELGAVGFITLLPITHSPSSIPAARFYGINFRVARVLPISWWDADWSVAAGPYFWDMLVPGEAYGVRSLLGVQAFFSMRKAPLGQRSYFSYLKFAPISEGLSSLGVGNREVALGAGYQLNSPVSLQPWYLTFDLADARYSSDTYQNSISLFSASLGVQTNF